MTYFLIWNSDGDTYVERIDPGKLARDIGAGDYGDHPQFLSALPDDDCSDTGYWPEGAHLLIKGEIVVPQAEQVVTMYKIA